MEFTICPEGRVFFIYDHTFLQKEEDDLKDAIIYFFPDTVEANTQCATCGQLMGMVTLFTHLFKSNPKLFKLKNDKFAVKHVGQYTLALAGSHKEMDNNLIQQLDDLYQTFAFYQASIDTVRKLCNTHEQFLQEMEFIWNTYLPFIRKYDDSLLTGFHMVPTVQLPRRGAKLFLQSSHILQACRYKPGILGGCIILKNSILCNQLPIGLAAKLCLVKPKQLHLPCQLIQTNLLLPVGVRILVVYLNLGESQQLRPVEQTEIQTQPPDIYEYGLSSILSHTSCLQEDMVMLMQRNEQEKDKERLLKMDQQNEGQSKEKGTASQDFSSREVITFMKPAENNENKKPTGTGDLIDEFLKDLMQFDDEATAQSTSLGKTESPLSSEVNVSDTIQRNCEKDKSTEIAEGMAPLNGIDICSENINPVTVENDNEPQDVVSVGVIDIVNDKESSANEENSMSLMGSSGFEEKDNDMESKEGMKTGSLSTSSYEDRTVVDLSIVTSNLVECSNNDQSCKIEDQSVNSENCAGTSVGIEEIKEFFSELKSDEFTSVTNNEESHYNNDGKSVESVFIIDTIPSEQDGDILDSEVDGSSKLNNVEHFTAAPLEENVRVSEKSELECSNGLINSTESNKENTAIAIDKAGTNVENLTDDINSAESNEEIVTVGINSAGSNGEIIVNDLDQAGSNEGITTIDIDRAGSNEEIVINDLDKAGSNEEMVTGDIDKAGSNEEMVTGDIDRAGSNEEVVRNGSNEGSVINDLDKTGSNEEIVTNDIDRAGSNEEITENISNENSTGKVHINAKRSVSQRKSSTSSCEYQEALDHSENHVGRSVFYCDSAGEQSEKRVPLTQNPISSSAKTCITGQDTENKVESLSDAGTANKSKLKKNSKCKKNKSRVVTDDSKDKLQEVRLYIQGHSDIALLLLMTPAAAENQSLIKELWKTSVTQLADLEMQIKECLQTAEETKYVPSMYSYLNYDTFERNLQGNMLDPISSVENEFVEIANNLHDDFSKSPEVSSVILKSHTCFVYGQQGVTNETYFMPNLTPREIADIPDPKDPAAFIYEQKIQKLLQSDLNITTI